MRSVFVGILILMHVIVPLVGAEGETSTVEGRETQVDVIGLNQFTVHRGEQIEVLFTLHNLGDQADTFNFDLVDAVDNLTITGLPLSKTLESGYLRQIKFNLSASIDEIGRAHV